MYLRRRLALVHFLALLSITGSALGQTYPGLSGDVHDSSGAVIVGATAVLLNARQASIGVARSDAEGCFLFPQIPLGSYELIAGHPGFSERRISIC